MVQPSESMEPRNFDPLFFLAHSKENIEEKGVKKYYDDWLRIWRVMAEMVKNDLFVNQLYKVENKGYKYTCFWLRGYEGR